MLSGEVPSLTLLLVLSIVALTCWRAVPTVSGCIRVAFLAALAAPNTSRMALSGRMFLWFC